MFIVRRKKLIGSRFAKGLFLDERFAQNPLSIDCFKIKNMSDEATSSCNSLKSEKSPYLLQHQHNPVHWYPWGEEAFTLAKVNNKPIFLSVGYSTCHWCHVMERESFEKEDVAKIMNKYFVNIKMDREERPDIDRIYMTFVQAVSGSGGWPMSVWMTPNLKPFYGGTYYPPEDSSFGRPGFKSLLLTIADQWKENSEKFITSADKILEVLERTATLPMTDNLPSSSEISNKCLHQLGRSYEPAFGGFSGIPAVDNPVNLSFLIYHRRANPESGDSLKMVDKTLRMIAKGGIHDHVGLGFCRYSTDKKWHVPHFEKMLYDNAQLATAYANTYLLTGDSFFSKIVSNILEYVNRDLSHNEGGFYSAEDADSLPSSDAKSKAEGAFYVWTKAETNKIFGSRQLSNGQTLSEMFEWRYGIRDNGNVDPHQDPHDELRNQNVLYIAHSVDETAKKFNVSGEEIRTACVEAKKLLFDYRNQNRPRPGLDTKIIASWNGLMISAFARAGCALNNQSYIDRAVKAMNFVTTHLISSSGNLYRTCYRDGNENDSPVANLKEPILACVDDFANLISANLELFDATWNLDFLNLAISLQKKQDEIFWDSEKGGYFNSRQSPHVIVRFKDDDDGAEPSSNSTSALNLVRLLSITENEQYKEKVTKLFKQFVDRLVKVPMTLPLMTAVYDAYTNGTTKFILILKKNDTKTETLTQVRKKLLPIGSSIVSLNVDSCSNLDEWKSLIPCITEKLEHFKSQDKEEVVYIRVGEKFAHTYNNSELDSLLNAIQTL